MSISTASDVYYDPYDVEINRDPYPVYERMREEAPLYYNAQHDFYALSRYEDVEAALTNPSVFISGRGGILEVIKAGIEMPPGILIFEDPPTHTIHRRLMARVFSPRRVASLEPEIRGFCAASLDPLVEGGRFDFVGDIGAHMPMRTIGMLLGVPEDDQQAVRDRVDKTIRTEPGKPMTVRQGFVSGGMFKEYIDWRAEHPSDDIMTELLNAEFVDETGTTRHLTRNELLTYINVIAGAGNETTTRLVGWTGKVLADHPDQRRELVADRSLIPNAIEEILRFESPAPHVGRVTATDVDIAGGTIPAGSAVLLMMGSANRDPRQFADADRFDIHREIRPHLAFGFGIHFCLGSALARLEGRLALDEVLTRFPEWEVDEANARLAPTSTVRGWESLPVFVPGRG